MAAVTIPDLLGPDLLDAPDLKPECTSSAECTTASKPVCGAGGVCRACQDATDDTVCAAKSATRCITTGSNAGQCGACNPDTTAKLKENADCAAALATTPVCTESGSCTACTAHTQCSSLVCNFATGACTPAGDVAYVDNAPGCQTAVHDSTPPNAAYCEINQALSAGKGTIRVAGSATPYERMTLANSPLTLLLVGPGESASPTARIGGEGGEDCIFANVANDATQSFSLTIDGFEIGGTVSVKPKRGIRCNDDNAGDPETLTIHVIRSKITYNAEQGIDADNCILTVENSTIANNTLAGIDSNGKTTTVASSVIFANGDQGLKIDSSTYSISNNILRSNGSVAGIPAVLLLGTASGTFSFNTVSQNGGANNIEGGVQCSTSGVELRKIEYSIVAGNSQKSGTQFKDNCDLVQVVVGTDATADTDAIKDKPPTFLSATDLHLGAVAANDDCCIDKVAANLCVAKDIDGQTRPSGALCDIGADEVTP